MSTALFGNTSALGGSSGGNKHIVEFRAGRMTLKGRMVHPDKRKGLLYVYQGDDSLMHFCWKDRTTGEVEDDLLIFPEDCEFVRVNECTTGRVYVLKFKTFSKKYFFWMQEPKTDKDDDLCRRINEALNNPPTSGRGNGPQEGELQNLLNNMSQQQLMQLFGGVGQIGGLSSLLGTMGSGSSGSSSGTRATSGSTSSSRAGSTPRAEAPPRAPSRARDVPAPTATPPNTATATQPRSGQIFLSDLRRYFSDLGNAPPEEGARPAPESVDLAEAFASPEVVAAAAVSPAAARLAPHVPPAPEGETPDDVRTTLLSPQFAQAASLFSTALSSGQLGPVISQFGLGSEVTSAASSGDMHAFLKALEKNNKPSDPKPTDETDEKKKDDKPKDKCDKDDDSMALD